MPTARLSLASNIESRTASTVKDARLVNCLVEGKGQEKQIVKRPGLQALNITPALPAGQGQGLFAWNNYLIAGVANGVYLIEGQNKSTLLGSVTGTQLPFSFTSVANDVKLAFHNGSNLYTINAGTPPTFVGGVGLTGVVNSVHIDNGGGYYGYATACTVATGTPPTITKVAHGLVVGQGVQFTATTMPSGLVAGTTYQVASVPTADTFTVNTATDAGGAGAAVAVTTTGSGVSFLASPTVTFGASAGVTAVGVAQIFNHQVSGVILTTHGTGYTSTPAITFSAPVAGTIATITTNWTDVGTPGFSVDLYSYISSVTVNTGGTGYLTAPAVTPPSGGTIPAALFSTTNSSGVVVSVSVSSGGRFTFGTRTQATIASPTSSTATGTAVMASGGIQGPFAAGMAYLDGKCYVMGTDGKVYDSATDNPASWAGTYLQAGSDPDGGVALVRHLNYLLCFGQWSTECFYDAGNPTGSPLGNNQSGKMEIGCASGYSVASAEQTVIWVGQSLTEGRSVYLMDGLSPVKISNRYIDKYLNSAEMGIVFDSFFGKNISNVRSYCMKLSGHTLYVLTFDEPSKTFVYDLDEKHWYEWSSLKATNTSLAVNNLPIGNNIDYVLNQSGQFNSIKVGDVVQFSRLVPGAGLTSTTLTTNRNYYVVSVGTVPSPYNYPMFRISDTPGGTPIAFGVAGQSGFIDADVLIEGYYAPTAYDGNIEYQAGIYLQDDNLGLIYKQTPDYTSDNGYSIFVRSVSPILDNGTTKRKFYKGRVEIVGDKVVGTAFIRHSDNDYNTWSSYRSIDLNADRSTMYQNGSARRRAWEVLITDNIPVRLDSLEIDIDIGEEEQ